MSTLKPKLFTTLRDYSKEQFLKDVTAGIIVAIIALPLSIALAIASGVTPEKGLYTAIIAGFLISMLGGSRVQIGGPTGAFMVIVYGIVSEFGVDGLVIATIMAGIIMIVMGLLKLGSLIKFIPYPITTGFTSGIAVVIFSSQIKDFFGLQMGEVPVEFLGKWGSYFKAFNTINVQTTLIGVLALLIIVLWPKVNKKIPGALIALVITSIIVKTLGLEVATIGSKYGELSSKLPSINIPNIDMHKFKLLIIPAFTIAILGSIESLLSAVVSDGMIGGKHRSNMELVAQGIANIGSGLFGGIPATGAIARTVANIKNGGRTPVAGMVHALTLLLIMVVFMPFAKMIPLASLAAILIVVAYNMSEWREFKSLLKSPKSDALVLVVTFFITVLVDLVKAIEIGMVLSAFLFMKRMAEVSNVKTFLLDSAEEEDEEDGDNLRGINSKLISNNNVQIYEINGPLFFGAADKFMEAMNEVGNEVETLIVDMKNVPAMDATALHAFQRMIDMCKDKNIKIIISGIKEQPKLALEKSDIINLIGENNIFMNLEDAII
ncbi:sulfate permease, SulP family [Clostridium amylolyticum]|uniref:Sulfate permease, SulP family n=1 Tax=Clostridium amylolyticum TaxID=1121298 RepID=A0A1M6ICJ4_9CLOT|nr:sulfate permease [Clostridium amylolyticum]SHJ32182.1 sulfate permease, SulP family [Clostridium amylolyticum]